MNSDKSMDKMRFQYASDEGEKGESASKMVPRNGTYLRSSFISVAMVFLCVSTTLIFLTELHHLELAYNNRYLLVEIMKQGSKNGDRISSTSTEHPDWTTWHENSTAFPIPATSSSGEGTQDDVTVVSTTPPIPERKNPVVILNERPLRPKSYNLTTACDNPLVFSAQISITLSTNGSNYLSLESFGVSKKVARQKVAYEALKILYQEELDRVEINPEWDAPIPSCNVNANTLQEIGNPEIA